MTDNYSLGDPAVLDRASRLRQARKILAVLEHFDDGSGNLAAWRCLDLGCSVGIITRALGERMAWAVGLDVDRHALALGAAVGNAEGRRSALLMASGEAIPVAADSFDVVVCNQVYQYVPDVAALFAEIRRVLRPGGLCYFSARNLWGVASPQNWRPLLATLPRRAASPLPRASGGPAGWQHIAGRLWPYAALREVVGHYFPQVHDYTRAVLTESELASIFLSPGRRLMAARLAPLLRWLLPILPTHIWLLQKP